MANQTLHKEEWHLDKKVPLALIAALLIQFAATVGFISSLRSISDENTRRIGVMENHRTPERMTALEVQMLDSKALLLRIDTKIDRLSERSAANFPNQPRP